jgi:hypothetical protein
MRTRAAPAVLIVVLAVSSLSAQPSRNLSVEHVLDRMAAYFEVYETQLSAITADERYQQRLQRFLGAPRERGALLSTQERTLESEVAFVRLPGGEEWAGFRDVRRVDGRSTARGGIRLTELMARGSSALEQAVAITVASSKHNLGTPRTTNMPTVPLEIIHPRNRARFTHRLDGSARVRGARTERVIFEEIVRPSIIQRPGGGDVRSTAVAWIEPATGKVWRVELVFVDWNAGSTRDDIRLRVEFDLDHRLQTMVPVEMRETFYVPGGEGRGRATYRNFKRFETSARIVQ